MSQGSLTRLYHKPRLGMTVFASATRAHPNRSWQARWRRLFSAAGEAILWPFAPSDTKNTEEGESTQPSCGNSPRKRIKCFHRSSRKSATSLWQKASSVPSLLPLCPSVYNVLVSLNCFTPPAARCGALLRMLSLFVC
jgi:hypothetical protein